jgi:hypothetical protein
MRASSASCSPDQGLRATPAQAMRSTGLSAA